MKRSAVIIGIGVSFGIAAHPVVGAVTAIVLLVLPQVMSQRIRRRANRRFESDLVMIIENAARSVRSGMLLSDALDDAARRTPGPGAACICDLVRNLRHEHHVDATVSWLQEYPGPSMQVVAAAVAMTGGLAGGSARGLQAAAAVLRERERTRLAIEAGMSQATTSVRMLLVLPMVVAFGGLLFGPAMFGRAVTQPAVLGVVAVGVLFEVVGAWWSQHLIASIRGGAR